MYFTQDHEDAIIKYTATTDNKIRSELYVRWIQPAFDEMVDKIVYTYRFTNLPNIDDLRAECKVWLTTVLNKYDPSKGSKAFSYFSVITKNWFIHKVKRQQKRNRREVDYGNISKRGKSLMKRNRDIFTLNKMTNKLHEIIDSYTKNIPQQVSLNLPKLKKVEKPKLPKLPKLKKV